MTGLKCVFSNTVYLTVLSPPCSLFKFFKHYGSILIILYHIVQIIREFEGWVLRKPGVWNRCEVRRYQWLLRIDGARDTLSSTNFHWNFWVCGRKAIEFAETAGVSTIVVIAEARIWIDLSRMWVLLRQLACPLHAQIPSECMILETTIVRSIAAELLWSFCQ